MSNIAIYVASIAAVNPSTTGLPIRYDIHIVLDDWSFPGNTWHDVAVVILRWWIHGYLEMTHLGQPVENDFMEGPYLFTVELVHTDELIVECKRRGLTDVEILRTARVDRHQYREQLGLAAEKLLALSAESQAGSSDWNQLRDAARRLGEKP
jgi:hypothetical protein